MTSILPGKFDGSSDLATWLREFDACSLANDWKEEEEIKKLPAFLRGPAANHFYAIPADDRKTYKDQNAHWCHMPYRPTRKFLRGVRSKNTTTRRGSSCL